MSSATEKSDLCLMNVNVNAVIKNLEEELQANLYFNHRFTSCICFHMFFTVLFFFGRQMFFFHEQSAFLEITEWEPC